MKWGIGQRLRQEWQVWQVGAIPGLLLIGLVILLRITGQLQYAEWFVLDYLLQSRPPEPIDERILIVGIDEADIRQIGTYPIPDRHLANLITTLQQHQPAVIGLDLFRDLAVEPGHAEFTRVLQSSSNLIGIEKVNPEDSIHPPLLPPSQVGFVDSVTDDDGFLRRSLLGRSIPSGEYKLSWTIRLAEHYLATQGVTLENGIRDPVAMRFGKAELTPLQPNSGGYVDADTGGNQTLVHFRSGEQPFQIVSSRAVMNGTVADEWIRDRIVLIGITASSVKDVVSVAATPGRLALINGVEFQAHAVSQIINAALEGRPLLQGWSEGWEYFWIVAWGVLGISLGRMIRSPFKLLLGAGAACFLLVSLSYVLLLLGWWIPLVPAFLALFLNGAGLTAAVFYRHEQNLRMKLHDRQLVIDQTFDAIHNGPLQTLAQMLRETQERGMGSDPLYIDLKTLNQELRAVYEAMRREAIVQDNSFHLGQDQELNLNSPLHELLYEVYVYTLNRDFPCFKTLRINITTFEPIEDSFLTIEHKRGLCRFLEEALCNVGKYATGITRLEVICKLEGKQNVIRIVDNGISIVYGTSDATNDNTEDESNRPGGRGTQQARDLAKQLGGQFQRSIQSPKGMRCEISWTTAKPPFWRSFKF